jgi:hypothetical protein
MVLESHDVNIRIVILQCGQTGKHCRGNIWGELI